MFVLHVDLSSKEAQSEELEQTYLHEFLPAISAQDGFRDVQLLRSIEEAGSYTLVIAFEGQAQQQKWVASDLHQKVWPALEKNCAGSSLRKYNDVT